MYRIIMFLFPGMLFSQHLDPAEIQSVVEPLSVGRVMRGDADTGFREVLAPSEFVFPRDHGSHDAYRTEWWYVTGNLESPQGRSFGFQLTFFRYALSPQPIATASAWRSHQVFMAHLAISDIEGQRFHAHERFSRGALGLAGASSERLAVWLEDWSLASAADAEFPVRLKAFAGEQGIELELQQGKPLVLQGDRGYSVKNSGAGNASYYYSYTRLPTRGRIVLEGQSYAVQGASWLDREWSSSALGEGQLGWDWFALQLSDGSELMLYRFRRRDARRDPHDYGVWVAADGSTEKLGAENFSIAIKDYWQSPRGTLYPAAWRVTLPEREMELDIRPAFADQELDLSIRYWEGAVIVEGKRAGELISGRGYVELAGYADEGDRAKHHREK